MVDDVSFDVAGGEIVGLFGLVGSGAGVVGKAIFGGWRGAVVGDVEIDGVSITASHAERRHRPRHRLRDPGSTRRPRRDPLDRRQHRAGQPRRVPPRRRSSTRSTSAPSRAAGSASSPSALPARHAAVATLSGGNQQKVQVARWLVADTPILILDDPTRGVDVGARAEIHEILLELAASGRALLLVSSDAGELVTLCSRILVMRDGRLVRQLAADEATEGTLIEIAAGGTSESDQEATR